MTSAAVAGLLGVATLAALVAGRVPFAVVVVVLSVGLLADFSGLLARAGPRPVTLAAAVPGIGLPAAVAVRPETGWTAVPDFAAAGVLAAFVIVLVFGRRRDVTAALGGSALAGLVVGLGATGLLLLRALPDGFRWVLGVLAVVAAVDVARQSAASRMRAPAAGAATVAAALVASGLLAAVADPPFSLATAAGVAAVALLAVAAAVVLHEAVDDAVANATVDATRPRPSRRGGVLVFAALPALLAAPAAYAIARVAIL